MAQHELRSAVLGPLLGGAAGAALGAAFGAAAGNAGLGAATGAGAGLVLGTAGVAAAGYTIAFTGGWIRTVEVLVLAVVWFAALWITRRPSKVTV